MCTTTPAEGPGTTASADIPAGDVATAASAGADDANSEDDDSDDDDGGAQPLARGDSTTLHPPHSSACGRTAGAAGTSRRLGSAPGHTTHGRRSPRDRDVGGGPAQG